MQHQPTPVDWSDIRFRAQRFPEDAFQFVRDGLGHTVRTIHGRSSAPTDLLDESRHVSGQQLCLGLRDLAMNRYGMLARAVLNHWGLTRTDDFGVIVFAMVDRGELRAGARDSFDDFKGVYDFDEAFQHRTLGAV